MRERQGYIGIDRFRIAAALLVVAIHTSPLLSLGQVPDFIFTRVLARLGVPFFLAASGFFLLAPYAQNPRAGAAPVLRFARKTAVVYGVSILLYLPVNLYAGHWRGVNTPGQALKMLLVDSTMYHLWYLPAAILGVLVVWLLLRCAGLWVAAGVAAGLYVVGLLGDSYYGFITGIPWLKGIYEGIFAAGSYTRNGLFYAPIFLLMGVWAARRQAMARGRAAAGLAVALALMLAEGLVLRAAGTQRHDSMYVMLPLCVFLLVVWLASFRGASSKTLREVSLLVYILHPWVIVLLRGGAGLLGLEGLLVKNSVVHYVAVCALSFAAAGALVLVWGRLRRGGQAPPSRAWMEVDLAALAHNAALLQGMLPPGGRLMPVVKANAYGLGAVPVARALQREGARDFCVACLSEGIALRRGGVRGSILVLGYTHPDDACLARRHRLALTVVDHAHGLALAGQGIPLDVHLKVDTGMHRLGESSEHTAELCELLGLKGLRVQGIYTQLSCCDSPAPEDIEYTGGQIAAFRAVLAEIERRGLPLPEVHIQCSYGILNYPAAGAAGARPGLALYGVVDPARCLGPAPALEPVFAVKARVALVKKVRKGERVGYNHGCFAPRDMRVAVLTMGYADGLPRALSAGAGRVLVRGRPAPLVGSVCMDQAMADVSGIEGAAAGDVAVVVGRSGEAEITVGELAGWAGTIPNEVMSGFGQRLARQYS